MTHSKLTISQGLAMLMEHNEGELADIQAASIIAWSMDTKAGRIESAIINDLIATQCAQAMKLKAYLK